MQIDINQDYTWSMVVPTSMGVRICPSEGQTVASSNMFRMQATSAETNVASISSFLGLPVKVLTTFVKDSQIAAFIKQDLRARGMAFEGKDVESLSDIKDVLYEKKKGDKITLTVAYANKKSYSEKEVEVTLS